ncbi:glycosyltransferase family 2 protein [Tropicimonas sediminicola]|uniref:Glycosyl transferase family 2 n=1 Tax=Tropicimonas sediminicola TaxID=1031541 RepID=A0A239L4B6_9RHOB|nr:glycosyltransferase family 2 protein [Tropicimonas sediminicola]SNT24673.1 Glycosyl transferase family 2 [Tropicimonas sediminicola]
MTEAPVAPPLSPWMATRMRWKRRRLLWRAFLSRHVLRPVVDRTSEIAAGDVLAFTTLRNEIARLPYFLDHHRRLGVAHFLIVDNGSTDTGPVFLADQPDVSLWQTSASYREARFGMDWLGWLLMRHGAGHWCLTVDADELLIYPQWQTRPLPALCARLEQTGAPALGALMLDLYPREPLGTGLAPADPLEVLRGFDPGPYRARRRARDGALIVQGGTRERVFFADTPERGPTLNKLPLVKWRRGHAYANASHSMLPPALNRAWDGPGDTRLSGVLLHTKFLPGIVERSVEERTRGQHFGEPAAFDAYYGAIAARPTIWSEETLTLDGWEQLCALGLMADGGWR